MTYYNQAVLKTYNDAKDYFSKAKSPSKGRPLNSWGRLYQVGDEYIVRVKTMNVAKFTPDNKLVFIVSPKDARSYGQTLSSSLHRAIPILWMRAGMQRYRLQHTAIIDSKLSQSKTIYLWHVVNAELKTAPELFDGLTFDLATGNAVNARKDLKDSVIPDRRTEWLRKLRKFKRGISVRQRMGVFDGYIKEVYADSKSAYAKRPNWNDESTLDMLYNAINNEDFPPNLLKAFVHPSHMFGWGRIPESKQVLKVVDSLTKEYSVELRKKFGVFEIQEKAA